MKHRFLVIVLLLSIACALLAMLFSDADEGAPPTLAELASIDHRSNLPVPTNFDFRPLAEGQALLASLEMKSIFYGVLGVCGVLLALRAVISAVRVLREERLLAARRSMGLDAPTRGQVSLHREPQLASVFVPVATRSALEQRGAKKAITVSERSASMPGRSRRLRDNLALYTQGLTGRMIFTFTGIVGAFGLVSVALVYFTLSSSLSRHVIQRARVMAVNVSDGAPGYLLKNNAAGLRELLRKHANRPELAYILIQDGSEEIVAHTFGTLPQEVRGSSSLDNKFSESQRTLQIGGNTVYEVSFPILEGRMGLVRLGIWRDQVNAENNQTLMPLLKLLSLVVSGGILLALFLVWRINRPILKLVEAAKAISRGNLDAPSPDVEDTGEFGELSRALERMRSSVRAAMIRLSR